MSQVFQKLLNCHVGIPNQSPQQPLLKLSVQRNGEGDGRTFLTQDNVTSNNPINSPACLNEGLNSFLARNDRKLCHSDHDFNNSALLPELLHSLLSQRFEAADYGLFNVLQSFFDGLTLRVAAGQGRAAHDVATFFSLLNDDLELHGILLVDVIEKGYCWLYLSISSSFCRTNLPKSVKTYALEPFGESSRRIGFTSPSLINSSILRLTEFLSPFAILSSSIQVFGSLSERNKTKPFALPRDASMFSKFDIKSSVRAKIHLFWVENCYFVIEHKQSNKSETFKYMCMKLDTKFGG